MKYRMYQNKFPFISICCALLLTACAGSEPAPESGLFRDPAAADRAAREPASMKGNFDWINQVEDDFARIASETSVRSIASGKKENILIKRKRWSFRYNNEANDFYLKLGSSDYEMVQTNFESRSSFSFAAVGQTENPVTLLVQAGEARDLASSGNCNFELSFWDDASKRYRKDTATVRGARCNKVMQQLRSYVP